MQVLNATKSVKSILADDGELIQLLPGQVSKLFTASSSTIKAAINLGDPNQIGIILGGSWERDIAKSITACAPYLYTDMEEAKSKLLDPSIDYESKAKAEVSVMKDTAKEQQYLTEIETLRKMIEAKDERIAEISNNIELSKLQDKLTDAENRIKDTEKERDNYKSQLTEAQDQVSDLSRDYNKIKNQLNQNQNTLIEAQKKIDELSEENQNLKNAEQPADNSAEVSELRQNVDDLFKENQDLKKKLTKKDSEIENLSSQIEDLNMQISNSTEADINIENLKTENENLKSALEDAKSKIESMVSEFNTACDKFKITKDDNGDWIQLTE